MYTTERYGTYQNAVKVRSIDNQKWKSKYLTMYTLNINDDISLEILSKSDNSFMLKIILNSTLFFALSIFITPIFVTIILMMKGNNIPLGIVITYILAYFVSSFLLRLYLWNRFGKEVFILNKKQLTFYHDYKYFKSNYEKLDYYSIKVYAEINSTLVDVSFMQMNQNQDFNSSIICFELNNKLIKSNGKIPVPVFIEIEKNINSIL